MDKIDGNKDVTHPFLMFEILFFALFGLQNADSLKISTLIQSWTKFAFRLAFGYSKSI